MTSRVGTMTAVWVTLGWSLLACLPAHSQQPAAPDKAPAPNEQEAGGNLAAAMQLFSRQDKDADGKVSKQEAAAGFWTLFGRFDANGDGALDKDEFAAPFKEGRVRIGAGVGQQPRGPSDELLSRLESDYWPRKSRSMAPEAADPLTCEDVPGDGVWVDPALRQVAADWIPVTVWFDRQLLGDGAAYSRRGKELSGELRRPLRQRVVDTLKSLSDQSYLSCEKQVRALVEDGRVQLVEWHWIVNGFSCLASPEGLAGLEHVPGVKKVFLARGRIPAIAGAGAVEASFFPDRAEKTAEPAAFEHPWYIRQLLADKVWKQFRITGKGTLNVVMDGSFVFSPNVTANLYRNSRETPGNGEDDDGNGLIDDYHGFDFARGTALSSVAAPRADLPRFAPYMHGFMCAAIICSTGSEDCQYEFGLAPSATWAGVIAAARFEPAVEWAIEQRADTLSMSFSRPNLGEYRSHWRKVLEQAAFCGLCSASGAGNFAREGSPTYAPVPIQLRTPEDIPLAVFAPAGVQRDLTRTSFSSQGPVKWETEHYAEGTVPKPDFCGFNANLPALLPNGKVLPGGLNGNSFAGPMAAGTLALMLSADPDLLPWDAREILTATCTDVADPGVDSQTGHGLINSYRAVKEVLRRRAVRQGEDPSAYEGREPDDQWQPVAGAPGPVFE
ncbi:MAG: S8 family serine peptidase [Pirellulaceae bacterium]|nr:S8 family serine peptidase [Pirellulaceae bacterium]